MLERGFVLWTAAWLLPTASASAANVQVVNALFDSVTINMDGAVSTLTLSQDAGGAQRIHEDGDALSLRGDPGVCAPDGADLVRTGSYFFWTVTNSGGSGRPRTEPAIRSTPRSRSSRRRRWGTY